MTLVDPVSPDFNIGEEYTVSVPLSCDPGIVLFRFFFEIPGPSPIVVFGSAVGLHSLTITP